MRFSKQIFLLVSILYVSISIFSQGHYAQGIDLLDVQFINPNEGWAVGKSGLIIHTSNAGQSWEQQYSGTTDILSSVCFVDPMNGWAAGQFMCILRTTDGGNNWITQNSEDSCILGQIYFLDINEGWAVGSCGKILHTTNGGDNWTEQNSGTTSRKFYSVHFTDNLHGWTGGLGKVLYRTSNGGQTWDVLQPYVYTNIAYHGIQFTDNLHGWRTGGGTAYTTDGGISWTESINYSGRDLEMLDESNGYAVGSFSSVLKTTDGIDWSHNQIGYGNRLFGVSFTDKMTGWAVGEYGIILHTTDGGVSWKRQGNGILESRVFGNIGTLWVFISDLELVTDVIEVDILEKVSQPSVLVDIEVTIDTVLHPSVSDLELYLTHGGITDTLIYQSSCTGENFIGTTFSDQGSELISSGTAPYTSIFKPSQPLSHFVGMDANGEWTLGIYDSETGNTGKFKGWSLTLYFETPVGVSNEIVDIIRNFDLKQNYPNPFNPSTKIKYEIPDQDRNDNAHVTLRVYDILGREAATLVNEQQRPGIYEIEWNAENHSSGVYFYKIRAGEFANAKKMILLR